LACRTGMILALVLAADGPSLPRTMPLGRHSPAALVLIVDNSASSSLIFEGQPLVDALLGQAHRILERATAADRLWLILSDGVVRAGTAQELGQRLAEVRSAPNRLDLGGAVRQGRELIRASGREGEVVILTDGQASALSAGGAGARVMVIRPEGAAPDNRSVVLLDPGSQPWGPDGGRIDLVVGGADTAMLPVTVSVDGNSRRELLVAPGSATGIRMSPPGGWRIVAAMIAADELLADNRREIALRVAPPAAASWNREDRFVTAAMEVLVESGRLRSGNGVTIGSLGPGPSIVTPPQDPALVGVLNRSLASRGIGWRYGAMHVEAATSDSGASLLAQPVTVTRRHALEATGGAGDTLATIEGEPWLVRSGDVLLLGSRMDPTWTSLPVSASFVPFIDALATRAVRGEPLLPTVSAGEPLRLPPRATAIMPAGSAAIPVEGGADWTPGEAGVFWLLEGVDTLGALTAVIDARESELRRATAREIEAAWPGAVVSGFDDGVSRTFTASGRGDLRPLLLLLAVLLLGCEALLARGLRQP
ncbi:MAG TPA: hypothetical protein PLL69_11805, partial [Gemmatimonadales bacterium]|nr:hypothetical protein [Gemmatimonadales bacterium]